MAPSPDVVIIGGGVIGSTIALRLAQKNLRVTVLDQSEPHCRNGILLAPVTGRIAADIIFKGSSEFDVSPFSVSRFQNT